MAPNMVFIGSRQQPVASGNQNASYILHSFSVYFSSTFLIIIIEFSKETKCKY